MNILHNVVDGVGQGLCRAILSSRKGPTEAVERHVVMQVLSNTWQVPHHLHLWVRKLVCGGFPNLSLTLGALGCVRNCSLDEQEP